MCVEYESNMYSLDPFFKKLFLFNCEYGPFR